MVLAFSGEALLSAVVDTDGDGWADERESYENGERVRLDTDTNGDHRPDVMQYLAGEEVTRQDEDSEFDGKISDLQLGTTPFASAGDTARAKAAQILVM